MGDREPRSLETRIPAPNGGLPPIPDSAGSGSSDMTSPVAGLQFRGRTLAFTQVPDWRQDAWDDWVVDAPTGHMHQCHWWASPLRAYGMTSRVVAGVDGNVFVGGTLFRSTPLPFLPRQIIESLDGPVFAAWDASYARPYADEIATYARETGALAVVFRGCPDPIIHGDLASALRSQQGDVILSQGVTDAIIDLDGQTTDSLLRGCSHGVRYQLKRAKRSNVVVEQLTEPERLRAAYETWMATARRKAFESVRPWPALEPVSRHIAASGAGVVFGAIVDGTVVAAVLVTYIGRRAIYVYGGHLDGAEQYAPAHLLQLTAIEEAIDRRFSEYSFGGLPARGDAEKSGIDRFKLSFGARPKPTSDTITWRRNLRLYKAFTSVREQRAGARIEQILRRRAVVRGSNG